MILTIGKKYRATFEDCCVSGTFESVLIRAETCDDESISGGDVDTEGRLYALCFANGVRMYEAFWGTKYELAEGDAP
jgi:hypothetical protein